jgi:hypothetical protein
MPIASQSTTLYWRSELISATLRTPPRVRVLQIPFFLITDMKKMTQITRPFLGFVLTLFEVLNSPRLHATLLRAVILELERP